MGNVTPKQMIEAAAIHLLRLDRPRRRLALRQHLLRLFGQHKVAHAAGPIGECGCNRMQPVQPKRTAWRIGDMWPLLALEIRSGPVMKRLALRARSVLALATRALSWSLLPIVGLAMMTRRPARTTARTRRPTAASGPIGMGRFHCAGYRPRCGEWTGAKGLIAHGRR